MTRQVHSETVLTRKWQATPSSFNSLLLSFENEKSFVVYHGFLDFDFSLCFIASSSPSSPPSSSLGYPIAHSDSAIVASHLRIALERGPRWSE
jgi:hypothetical protein